MQDRMTTGSFTLRRDANLSRAVMIIIVIAAGFFRFYHLSTNPNGLFCDEASVGYNAYSILESGKDEHGNLFPLYFKAFGDYKSPVYIYLTTIPVLIFGLTEFATRFWSAFLGTLTVLYMYLLAKEAFGGRRWLGVTCAFVLAFMPWHIHLSRFATDGVNTMVFFNVAGIYYLMAGRNRRPRLLYLGALFMGIGIYNYNIGKLMCPLLFFLFILINSKKLWRNRRATTFITIGVFALCCVPLAYYTKTQPAGARARWKQVSIFEEDSDAESLMKRYWSNYQGHFSKDFLFVRGDHEEIRHSPRFGELLPVSYTFVIAGGLYLLVAGLVKRRGDYIYFLLWLAVFPVAGSLTKNVFATRAEIGAPAFAILTGTGLYLPFLFIECFSGMTRKLMGIGGAVYICIVGWYFGSDFARFYNEYFYRYPVYSAPFYGGWQYGQREAVRYLVSKKDQYDLLVTTPSESNQPQIFHLFYTAFDPAILHKRGLGGLRSHKKLVVGSLKDNHIKRACQSKKVLLAVREPELKLLENYRVHKRIFAPDGKSVFVIISDVEYGNFLDKWFVLGPFGGKFDRDYLAVSYKGEREEYTESGAVSYLSDLDPMDVIHEFGELRADRTIDGGPLRINQERYEKGLGTHANSEIVYEVPQGFDYFVSDIGLDDEMDGADAGSIVFKVILDDKLKYKSPVLTKHNDHLRVVVPVKGAKKLRLIVADAGDGIGCDHADWAGARFVEFADLREVARFDVPKPSKTGRVDLRGAYIDKYGHPAFWRRYRSGASGYVELNNFFGRRNEEHASAYALNIVRSPDERKVKLKMGFDDGGKVWVNDKLIFSERIGRTAKLVDDYVVEVNLRSGDNKILVKCVEGVGDWRFIFRITSINDGPQPDLVYRY